MSTTDAAEMPPSSNISAPGILPYTSERSAYRWVVLLLLTASLCICFVDRLAWANVASEYARENGYSLAAVGTFFSAFFIGYLVMTGLSGFVADSVGGKRVLCTTLLVLGVLTAAFGTTRTLWAGLAIQTAMGFAAGADYASCLKLISVWFSAKERATAIGLFLSATPLSLVITNATIPLLMNRIGWQGVYFILGAATFVVGLFVLFFARDVKASASGNAGKKPPFGLLLKSPHLLVSAFCGFALFWAVFGFMFWANTLLIKGRGFSPVTVGFIIAFFGFSGLVVKPSAGWIADHVRVSKLTLVIPTALIFALALVVFAQLETIPALVICIAVIGISAWSSAVFTQVAVIDSIDNKLAGSATGLSNSLWNLGNSIVPVVVGAVYDWTSSLTVAFGVLALGPALAAVLAFVGTRYLPQRISNMVD